MFIFLAILALSKDLRENPFLKTETNPSWYFTLLENIGDLVGEGITPITFKQLADGINPAAAQYYNSIVPLISNTSIQLIDLIYKYNSVYNNQNNGANGAQSSNKNEGSGIRYSQLLNENINIINILPDNMKVMLENDDMFNQISGIVTLIGNDLSTVLNLDYATIFNVYTYIMASRKEEGGVKLGEIIKRLGLSTSWIPQMQKVVANFDSPVPIYTLFDGLNCRSEYNAFVKAASSFNVPSNYTQKFLSTDNIFNLIGSIFNLVKAINNKFVQTSLQNVIKPIISNYLIKIVDISNGPIKDRAESIINIINVIKSFGTSCPSTPPKEDQVPNMKCVLYSTVQSMVCGSNDACKKEVWNTLVGYVKPFAEDEVNLMAELKKFGFSENDIKFYFGLISMLTDGSKNYLNVIEGLSLKFGAVPVYFGPYQGATYYEVSQNITKLIKFMSSIKDDSNFKEVFDYLNVSHYWDYAKYFVGQIAKNTSLCELIGTDVCTSMVIPMLQQLVPAIKADAPFFTIMQGILGQESPILPMLQYFVIPPLRTINNTIDKFLTYGLNLIQPALLSNYKVNVPLNVSFEGTVRKTGGVCEATLQMVNELLPSAFMKLPIIGDLYLQVAAKLSKLIGVIKNDQKVRDIADSLYDGIGVIIDMLYNAVSTITSNETKVSTVAQGLKPTTFLNVYATLVNFINLYSTNNMGIKDIIQCIQYGDPVVPQVLAAEISLENIIPIKNVAANSETLVQLLMSKNINVATAAQFLNISKEQLKGTLSSTVSKFNSAPAEAVKGVATSIGVKENDINNIFGQLASIGGATASGQTSSIKGGDSSSSKSDKKKDEMPAGTIIGIVVAVIVVIIAAILIGVYISAAKKRNQMSSVNQNDSDGGKNEDSKENDDL